MSVTMGRYEKSRISRYAFLTFGLAILALAGYIGYVLYPRFNLPSVTGAGLLLLAASAGIASFFSPCSFPLLVALLGRAPSAEATRGVRVRQSLLFSTALSLGASLFLILTGLAIAAGGGALFRDVTFTRAAGRIIRVVTGSLLVFLGLIQAGMLPFSFHKVENLLKPLFRAEADIRRRMPLIGFGLFGFTYLFAGFG